MTEKELLVAEDNALNLKSDDTVPIEVFQHRILIVDEDHQSAKMIESLLPASEYLIHIEHSGIETLTAAVESPPDLILLDILMPGINGYEVARKLKSSPETHHIPIIMISSLDGIENKLKGIEAGADEFLCKPIRKTELLARIKSLVRMKRYGEQIGVRQLTERRLLKNDPENGGAHLAFAPPPHILIVDDNEKDIKLLKSQLGGERVTISSVNSGEDALAVCFSKHGDILLLDLLLPGIDGYSICKHLKNDIRTRNIQILLISSLDDFQSKIKGIESGADDYLIKPAQSMELIVRVRALIKKKNYIDQLIADTQTGTPRAMVDTATGLYSYLYFKYFGDLEIERCRRREQPMMLISIWLESIDTTPLDTVLVDDGPILYALGTIIKKGIRKIDLAARTGLMRFSVIFPYSDRSHSAAIIKRLSSLIDEKLLNSINRILSNGIQIRFGVASYPLDGKTLAELVMVADHAQTEPGC